MMTEPRLTVSTYAGYRGDERPTAFTLAGRTFQVREIADRWYGVDHAYFKLIADDGNLYVIRHDAGTDAWELILTETFRSGRGNG
jgi:hypothetical protein